MTDSVVGNFCITATNETVTPTGGITCSALGGAVNRHLLRLRLTSARSSRRLRRSVAQWQTCRSPRVIRATFLLMPVGFTSQRPVQVSGFDDLAALPRCAASIRFLFVRPAVCLGFLQIRGRPRHPCLWLTLPLAGCVEDFHLQVTRLATTTKQVALRATRHAWRTIE
jgi:hypothetical protein